jgi:calcineurin-like phosphoesterase family protein
MKIKAFYSDPHYGHFNILKYCGRPFSSIQEMNREFIARYNSKIGPSDTVLWAVTVSFVHLPKLVRL